MEPHIPGSYTWDEDGEGNVTIHIAMSEELAKKDVDCVITATWIKAGLKNKPPIISGKLFEGINAGDSMWQIEKSTRQLMIHLEKVNPIPWAVLIVAPGPAPADRLDAQSLYYLGEAMEHGRGYSLPPNGPQALVQYVKAAEMNFIPALLRLARAYMPASSPAARLWGKGGQVSYGTSLDAIERNAQTSRHYYTKAAELGNPEAQAAAAWACLHPEMLEGKWEADEAAACKWAQRSSDAHCPEGSYVLALYYQAVADSGAAVAAVESLKKAIEDAPEHAGAIHALAWHQLRGTGGMRADRELARAQFARAKELDGRFGMPTDSEMNAAVRQGKAYFGPIPLDLVAVGVVGVAVLAAICYLRSKAKNS